MLDPDLLATFVAIAESGSFTEAAERVHRSQSAVSMQMRRLEEQIGRALFEKRGRGLVLSADGELLLGSARRVLRAHREMLAAFDGTALDGRVRVGSPDDYASTFLPGVLARFASAHPRVEVEVVCASSPELVRMIESEEVDLAIITERSGEQSGIVVHREPLVWVASSQHPVHLQDPVPLALFAQGCPFRGKALRSLGEAGKAWRIAYTSISLAGLYAALAAGLAVGVMGISSVGQGYRILDESHGFPPIGSFGIVLLRRAGTRTVLLDALEQHMLASFDARSPLLAA